MSIQQYKKKRNDVQGKTPTQLNKITITDPVTHISYMVDRKLLKYRFDKEAVLKSVNHYKNLLREQERIQTARNRNFGEIDKETAIFQIDSPR